MFVRENRDSGSEIPDGSEEEDCVKENVYVHEIGEA